VVYDRDIYFYFFKGFGALECFVGTASINLEAATYNKGKNPGYGGGPGAPTAEELEGGNPFFAQGATKAMREAFRSRTTASLRTYTNFH